MYKTVSTSFTWIQLMAVTIITEGSNAWEFTQVKVTRTSDGRWWQFICKVKATGYCKISTSDGASVPVSEKILGKYILFSYGYG